MTEREIPLCSIHPVSGDSGPYAGAVLIEGLVGEPRPARRTYYPAVYRQDEPPSIGSVDHIGPPTHNSLEAIASARSQAQLINAASILVGMKEGRL